MKYVDAPLMNKSFFSGHSAVSTHCPAVSRSKFRQEITSAFFLLIDSDFKLTFFLRNNNYNHFSQIYLFSCLGDVLELRLLRRTQLVEDRQQ